MIWFFLALGAAAFAVGLGSLLRGGRDKAARGRWGLCAYAGLGMVVLCGVLLLEPALSRAPAAWTWGAAFLVFLLAGGLLRSGKGKP